MARLLRQRLPGQPPGATPIWAPELTDRHVQNTRVYATREAMLSMVPKGGNCAEIGVETGYFSAQILERTHPRILHLIDLDFSVVRHDVFPIKAALDAGSVQLHQGKSAEVLRTFDDRALDWIYIDGDHSYEGVVKDIEEAVRVVKPEGLLIFNDYTQYSPLEQLPYGVMKAVNELCLARRYEVVGLALHGMGYFDAAVRRMRID